MAKRVSQSAIALVVMVALAGIGAASASAGSEGAFHLDSDLFGVESFSVSTSNSVAGARADFNNTIEVKSGISQEGPVRVYGRAKKFEVKLPDGLVGDPTAIPRCSLATFYRTLPFETCREETAVGYAVFDVPGYAGTEGPVFNLRPGPNEPALFGVKPSLALYALIRIRVSADGELTAVADENPLGGPVRIVDLDMFGVPADHELPGLRVPFMTNPTNCEQPFTADLDAESYEGKFDSGSSTLPPRSDCADLPFAPSMSVQPTSREAGAPSGLEVNLSVPQSKDPDGLATAHVKDVTMAFPEGLTLSPSAANGLGSCSPEQFGYHEETPIACPQSSKVGEIEVRTPLLEDPVSGPVYVAKQNDNPFNSLLALYMAPAGQGVELKLAGKVELDPSTGRMTTTFLNNPQQPFSELRVSLKDGPRAPLALPRACGTYSTTADLRSWAMPGEPVPLSSSFTVDQGCGREGGFAPGFSGGTANPKAGAFSPFTLRVTRPDNAQQNVSRIEATLPEGLLAKLAGVPLCPDAAAAAADCPEASKVGHTTVGVGAGPSPVFAPEPGKAPTALYLGGPYSGAPYSLVAEVPAQAGPFDLGTVVVRNALRVDPLTAQVTAVSDPLPQFLQGVPISYRDIRVDVDRPAFTLNPTSCEPKSIAGRIGSAAGQTAAVADRFQAGQCRALGFKPKLAIRLKGDSGRAGHPALTATMRARPGDANIGRVSVALPKSEFLAQNHIRTICTRVQFAADRCPPGSVYGRATATTPLLDQPLSGPVYLRSSDNPLPDLVVALKGVIEVDLVGHIDSFNLGIRTTFETVPDAPVTRFTLRMQGGKKSLLENSRNLCATTNRATVAMEGQNGRSHELQPVVKSVGCGQPKGKKKGR